MFLESELTRVMLFVFLMIAFLILRNSISRINSSGDSNRFASMVVLMLAGVVMLVDGVFVLSVNVRLFLTLPILTWFSLSLLIIVLCFVSSIQEFRGIRKRRARKKAEVEEARIRRRRIEEQRVNPETEASD